MMAASLVACGGSSSGSATVTANIGSAHLEFHTVYGWARTTKATSVQSVTTFSPTDPVPLILVLSGATFDPTKDFSYLPAATQLELADEQKRNGRIELRFPDITKAALNTPLVVNYDDSNQVYSPTVAFGETQVTNATLYPETVPRFGGKGTMSLTLDTLGSGVGGAFSGKLDYTVAKGANDPDNVLTGTVSVQFSGTLVGQAVAECEQNLAPQAYPQGSCNPNDP